MITRKDEEMVIHHAAKIAELIATYIHKNKELHKMGMTTVGYAVEMLLSTPFSNDEKTYDKESIMFREFLAVAHQDVKKMNKLIKEQEMAN